MIRNFINEFNLLDDMMKESMLPDTLKRERGSRLMATDALLKEDGKYILEINLPGIKKEDIEVTYKDETLTVKVESKEKEEKEYIFRERVFSGTRSFMIPDMDTKTLTAKMENGVLSLSFEKVKEKEPDVLKVEIL